MNNMENSFKRVGMKVAGIASFLAGGAMLMDKIWLNGVSFDTYMSYCNFKYSFAYSWIIIPWALVLAPLIIKEVKFNKKNENNLRLYEMREAFRKGDVM